MVGVIHPSLLNEAVLLECQKDSKHTIMGSFCAEESFLKYKLGEMHSIVRQAYRSFLINFCMMGRDGTFAALFTTLTSALLA